jgi:DNA-binding Lrp family transcriptional regulator
MDVLDRKILAELQQDGRLTVTELAGRVGLSLSPCHRRLQALEQSGAISGYHARLDANALGLSFEALVFATMRAGDRDAVDAFEQAVAAIPNVLQAQRLFDNRLATLPGVQRLSSTLVMKSVVENRPLPL